ncbi:MAG: formylglycine-generating enzyme family protein [Limisphaerales bacterium]
MKISRRLLALLVIALLSVLPTPTRAQDDTSDTATSDSDTNVPLKELMLKSDQITNTVGIVLKKISAGLWAGMYEVTQKSYQKVMDSNPSAFQGGDRPVDSVNWNDAMAFCQKLTEQEQKAGELPKGYIYNLPTQSQWENFVGDASLNDAVMSLNMQRRSSTAPVGSLGPNNYGLYDTRGNVMEWCLDPQDKPYHVLRGGAWDTYIGINARPEFREYSAPDKTKNDYGFRVVLEPK